jgi:hypothetical protein
MREDPKVSGHVDAVANLPHPARFDVYRDRKGEPVTITEDQFHAIWHAVSVWEAANEREHRTQGQVHLVDLRKSCLLGRMLFDGKAPFDDPPPLAYSAPWYALIEQGCAGLGDRDVTLGDRTVIICQTIWWRFPAVDDDGSILCSYDAERGGYWRLTSDVPPHAACGQYGYDWEGHKKGEPIPCAWWLERA